jgi:metal-sulfur cluster biosynthetic enzyme
MAGPRFDVDPAIVSALNGVVDPCSIATGRPISIIDMGLVRSIEVAGAAIRVGLRLTSPFCFQVPLIRREIETQLVAIGYVAEIDVDTADEWLPHMMSRDAQRDLRRIREGRSTA